MNEGIIRTFKVRLPLSTLQDRLTDVLGLQPTDLLTITAVTLVPAESSLFITCQIGDTEVEEVLSLDPSV